MSEMLKFNALLAHYEESKKQDAALTFSDFLLMHYVTDDNNSKDDSEDKQLPFASNLISFSLIGIPQGDFISDIKPVQLSQDEPVFIENSEILASTNYLMHVWHPPKVVI